MSSAQQQIDEAKKLISDAGIGEAVTPQLLVRSSKELDKTLQETLAYIAKMFARSEGSDDVV